MYIDIVVKIDVTLQFAQLTYSTISKRLLNNVDR